MVAITFLQVAQYLGTALIIIGGSAAFLGIVYYMFNGTPLPPDIDDDDTDFPLGIGGAA